MMSGSVHPLSVKYNILRSTSESAMFSLCASATILEIKNSLASCALWKAFMWRILLQFHVTAYGWRNIAISLVDSVGGGISRQEANRNNVNTAIEAVRNGC